MIMKKVSAIIPTYNEEVNIEKAIQSVSFADEIIVIDSYSTDNTIALAKKHNVRILYRKFDNFSAQKNYAIEKTTHKWVLLLDADERINHNLKLEILQVLKDEPTADAYWVYRRNFILKKEIKYSGWQNDKVIRLINKSLCKYNGKLVHEEIIAPQKTAYFQHKLDHHTYKDFKSFIYKKHRVAELQAQMLNTKTVKIFIPYVMLKSLFRFVNHYFLRRGFLDGYEGFFIASIYTYTIFTRYTKLWLIRKELNK